LNCRISKKNTTKGEGEKEVKEESTKKSHNDPK